MVLKLKQGARQNQLICVFEVMGEGLQRVYPLHPSFIDMDCFIVAVAESISYVLLVFLI